MPRTSKPAPTNVSAVIYCRLSKHRGTGVSLGAQRQEAESRRLCAARGWEVAAVLIDDDTSAYSGKPRPGYRQLLDLVRSGEVQAVVAWHSDRLYRKVTDLEELINLADKGGVELATVTAGSVDLSTALGRMHARGAVNVARYESEHSGERLVEKSDELATAGADHGGPRPFGYQRTALGLVVDPAEAKVVRQVFERVAGGESLRSIAADLGWHASQVRRICSAPRYLGLRVHRGEVVGKAAWPAIVTEDVYRRAGAILSEPGRGHGRGVGRKHLLAGLLTCHVCTTVLRSSVPKGIPGYSCPKPGCGATFITAKPAEEELIERLLALYDRVGAVPVPGESGVPGSEVAALESELGELAAMRGRREITNEEWLVAKRPIAAQLQAVQKAAAKDEATAAKVTVLTKYAAVPGSLRAAWPGLTFVERRAVLVGALVSCEVGPRDRRIRSFDPTRLRSDWR